jgi:hypothetical protein
MGFFKLNIKTGVAYETLPGDNHFCHQPPEGVTNNIGGRNFIFEFLDDDTKNEKYLFYTLYEMAHEIP